MTVSDKKHIRNCILLAFQLKENQSPPKSLNMICRAFDVTIHTTKNLRDARDFARDKTSKFKDEEPQHLSGSELSSNEKGKFLCELYKLHSNSCTFINKSSSLQEKAKN